MAATRFTLLLDGQPYEVERREGLIAVNGVEFSLAHKEGQVLVAGTPHAVKLGPGSAEVDGIAYAVEAQGLEEPKGARHRAGGHADAAAEGAVTAIMPGLIIKVLKAEGDAVAEGETVLILEAMKMQNEIKARQGGRIAQMKVKQGDNVEMRQLLCLIEQEAP